MTLARLAVRGLFAAALITVAGCGDNEGPDGARSWDVSKPGRKPENVGPDGKCVPDTCQKLNKSSGKTDDGCGETLDCSKAGSECTPKSCQELGKTSGSADDGCGKTLDCSATTAACPDSKGNNNTKETSADLGELDEDAWVGGNEKVVKDLQLSDGAEDWFRLHVVDAGLNGNPQIVAAAPNADISLFYVCDAKGDASECADGSASDNMIGKGCRGKATVTLNTYCDTLTESGTAYIRVKKAAATNACTTYALTVTVY